MTSQELAMLAAEAISEKKGSRINVLHLEGLTVIADYFILANGNSRVQTQAIAENVEKKLEEAGVKLLRKEGYAEGRWILLDFAFIIVHIFQQEEREFYNLERIWGDAPQVPIME
ncbi:MAG: ribosome silencing factor [Firmicutes bacterium HGW-Firmicutes-12]|jgi:ribosome-associated protein|nr:MAG: ribosome silencing factor [Firmicutes bacterium HGW-Firmicutes-12]